MVNWKISGRKRSSPGSRYYHSICGKGNETDKSQDSLQPDRHTENPILVMLYSVTLRSRLMDVVVTRMWYDKLTSKYESHREPPELPSVEVPAF